MSRERTAVIYCAPTGKLGYPSRAAAEQALRATFRRRSQARRSSKGRPTGPLESYQCRACGHWHLGGGPPSQLRKRRPS
jgi:hypothetical protein